jgi:hypothetical protein
LPSSSSVPVSTSPACSRVSSTNLRQPSGPWMSRSPLWATKSGARISSKTLRSSSLKTWLNLRTKARSSLHSTQRLLGRGGVVQCPTSGSEQLRMGQVDQHPRSGRSPIWKGANRQVVAQERQYRRRRIRAWLSSGPSPDLRPLSRRQRGCSARLQHLDLFARPWAGSSSPCAADMHAALKPRTSCAVKW